MSTLKVDTIQKRTGTGTINVGQSGDTIAMPSATLTTALPITSGGTGGTSFSAAGLANTPAFYAQLTSNQAMSDNTWTKVQFNSEDFDTDNTYDNSTNYRFTPAVAGKYYVFAGVNVDSGGADRIYYAQTKIYKNGSEYSVGYVDYTSNLIRASFVPIFSLMDLDADDYVEIYSRVDQSSGSPTIQGHSGRATFFGANKVIGA